MYLFHCYFVKVSLKKKIFRKERKKKFSRALNYFNFKMCSCGFEMI